MLEIGCAAGGNLIPFAAAHPRARVVGIDLSQVQIDQGRARVQALGLDNLELIAGDIAQMDLAALGQFDFVIAHGVYSWVPPEVQDALLASFRALLAPDGVAYLSYNVYPGWKSKEVVRDAMLLASGASATPDEKVREARGMVDFLEEVAPADGVLARVLAVSKEHALGFGDSYLLHDELETFNAPCYFYEMVGRAGAHGLAYLAEARPETMFPANFGPKVAEYLHAKSGGVQVLVEQYLDFVLNRMFRESLLVHAERAPQIRYRPGPKPVPRPCTSRPGCRPSTSRPGSTTPARSTWNPTARRCSPTTPASRPRSTRSVPRWPWTLSRQELVDAVHARLASAGFDSQRRPRRSRRQPDGGADPAGAAQFRLDPVLPEPVVARRCAWTKRPGGWPN